MGVTIANRAQSVRKKSDFEQKIEEQKREERKSEFPTLAKWDKNMTWPREMALWPRNGFIARPPVGAGVAAPEIEPN